VTMWHAVRGAATLAEREIVRFLRQRSRVVGAFLQPVLFWVLFGAGLHGSFAPPAWAPHDLTYAAYFFPGAAAMIVLFTAIFASASLIEDRREGFLQGVLAAPVPRGAIVAGKVVGGALLAVLQGGLFLVLAPLAGIGLTATGFAASLGWLLLMAVSLSALGFLLAWSLESIQGFHAVMSLFLLPMWLLSGAFFPAAESGWLSWVMWANPLTYGVAGLRRILGWPAEYPVAAGLPSLAACAAVTSAFAVGCLCAATAISYHRSARDTR